MLKRKYTPQWPRELLFPGKSLAMSCGSPPATSHVHVGPAHAFWTLKADSLPQNPHHPDLFSEYFIFLLSWLPATQMDSLIGNL